jgi:hypothetical protein
MHFLEVVAKATTDEEWVDRRKDVVTTVKALAEGRPFTGGRRLTELLDHGTEVVQKVRRWAEISGQADIASPRIVSVAGAGPSPDPPTPTMPRFPETGWRGLFARWRDLVGPVSEVSEVLHFVTFLVVVGLTFRRRVFFHYPKPHYPNFYAGLIAPTGDSHKTTALYFGERLADELGADLKVVKGISSPEGFLEEIGNWEKDEDGNRVSVPAFPTLLYLDETATLMAKAQQKATSGLLPLLMRLYDAPSKEQLPTRVNKLVILEPTVGFLTGTTPETLERGLHESILTDGFLNRVIWVTQDRLPDPIPSPRPPDQKAWNALLVELRHALDFWPDRATEIPLDAKADCLWRDIYVPWARNRQQSPGTLMTQATARTHTHIRKLALLGAALQCKTEVDEQTLLWAATLGDYFEEVTKWILKDAIVSATRAGALEQRIIRYLRDRPARSDQRSTREICQALHRYAGSAEIRAALKGMADIYVRCDPRRMPSGQVSDVWSLV